METKINLAKFNIQDKISVFTQALKQAIVLEYFKNIFLLFSFSVVAQKYDTGTSDSYIIVGNSALVKCEIPSFVADFVSISSWVDNQNNEYYPSDSLGTYNSVNEKMILRWDTQVCSSLKKMNQRLGSQFTLKGHK